MRARGILAAVAFLLVILGATYLVLLNTGRRLLVEAEQARRETDYEEAGTALEELIAQAAAAAQTLAAAESLERIASDQPAQRADGFRRLDQLLQQTVGRLPTLVRLEVLLPRGGPALCSFDRRLESAPPPILAPPRGLPPVATRAATLPPGVPVLGLAGEPDQATLRIAVTGRGGLVVMLELDAQTQLALCAERAGGGTWVLVEGDRPLWPPGAEPPFPARDAHTLPVTGVQDGAVLGNVKVSHPQGPGWRLLYRTPLGDRLDWTVQAVLATAAVAAVLVLLLGVRSARAVTLQRSLQEIGRRETELQGMFDAITDPLLVVDHTLTVVRANRAAVEEHGGSALVGRAYSEVVAQRGLEERRVAELASLFGDGLPRQVEQANTGRTRVWQVDQYPIFDTDLSVLGVVEHAQDVTETRRLQTQLIQSEKLSTLGEMAAGIAHEINNPIGVISMFAQLLAEEVDGEALEQVKTIEEQASNAGEIVRGLLRFARKSDGPKARFDVRTAVERAEAIVAHQKMLKQLDVRRELPQAPAYVLGDEGQLAQVILNLIVNAHHAMEGQGTLTIKVTHHEPGAAPPPGRAFGPASEGSARVRVTIGDSGQGIPPEALERIFEPFFTTKPAGEGTGLGLSVGFGIIRDHGGQIWVDSVAGEGTTFTLDLPAAESGEASATTEPGGTS